MNISMQDDKPKKLLVMRLIEGPIKKDIILYPEQMPMKFGRTNGSN